MEPVVGEPVFAYGSSMFRIYGLYGSFEGPVGFWSGAPSDDAALPDCLKEWSENGNYEHSACESS